MKLVLRASAAALTLLACAAPSCGSGSDPTPVDASPTLDSDDPNADTDLTTPAGAVVQFGVQSAGQDLSLPASTGGIAIESVILIVHELTLASDNGSTRIEGIRAVDLSTATTAIVPLPEARPGLYSRLVVSFEPPQMAKNIPPAFEGQHLDARIAGTLPSGTHFVIRNASEFGLNRVVATPFELKPGEALTAKVRFDVGQWFTGITLPEGTDPIEIDAAHNADLLSRFRTNLVQSASVSFE